ncbi:hypothetical protein MTR67_051958 [Solanum verrucosum]|uniref:Uncharacterized protein n=1 Tax=Solanum verrucosum TaxID=315347 RepID=A0AAF0V8E8_SOLVR|nr:hypothetical protein MTR67_051958 [Solanum verrucosum]
MRVDEVVQGLDKDSSGKVLQVLLQGLTMKGCLTLNPKEMVTDYKIKNCPLVAKNEGDNHRRAQPNPSSGPSGSGVNTPKQNLFRELPRCGNRFDMLPDVLIEPFSVSTPVGDSVLAKRIGCTHAMLPLIVELEWLSSNSQMSLS